MDNVKEIEENEMIFLINSMGEGGAQRVLLSLIEVYVDEGIDVTLISLAKNDFYELPTQVKKVYLRQKSKESSFIFETLLIPYYSWKLKKYVEKHKLKRVQSHLFRANFVNLISRFFASKHIIQVVNHTVVSRFLREGISGRINLFLIRTLYPKTDKLIYISKRMKEDFLSHVKDIGKKSHIIYNPYDISRILSESSNDCNNFTFDSSKKYLITVGRLVPLKKFENVLKVLSDLDNTIEVIMLGDGECRIALEDLAKELGIISRVHFLGQVKNPFAYISRADLFISSSSVEGFPNVLVEAMICHTAIISTDCISGPREILAPSTNYSYQLKEGLELAEFGILYAVGELEALKNAINILLKDKSLKVNYEMKAFEHSKTLSSLNISALYKEAYFK
ncbi:MAG TPA: glycosyltransferase [Arcobacter sp.]|nr:glycosyltransferase [Arcobacter sp.]